ncbi:MAG: alkaline phosphatase family protein [Alphaproteobacteria bacterium]|nr:alkaline phosphatase family protein [Alphaproteobacteria bacterium]
MTSRGAALGGLLGSAPGLVFGAWAVVQNPWFLDRPWLFLGLAVALPAAALAALGALLDRRPAGRAQLLWLAPLHAALLLLFWPRPGPDPVKLLVVGVDGATFDVIDPMVAAGALPAFAALQGAGDRTVLRSMEPMFSPLLWTTMATGKPPEQHGVRGFFTRSTDCRVPRLWDIAEDAGLRVGVYKWLVTYPPREVPGFMVPGWLAPSPETAPSTLSFVKELELANRLERRQVAARRGTVALALAGIPHGLRFGTLWAAFRWKLTERLERPGTDDRQVAMQRIRGQIDRDVFVHAVHAHQPDLATFTYYATDGLAHRFWDAHAPGPDTPPARVAAYGEAVRDAYRQADAILGELMARVGPDTTVVVLSDHGFRAFRPGVDAAPLVPLTERLQARLGAQLGRVQVARLGQKLTVTAEEASTDALIEALAALVDGDGAPAYAWEPVPGAADTLGVELVVSARDAAALGAGTVGGEPLADYARLGEPTPGEHDGAGIFIAAGPGIEAGALPREAALLDVAPTLQALLGVAPAQDLTGRVLLGDPRRGPESRDGLAERFRVEGGVEGVDVEALRALGYLE